MDVKMTAKINLLVLNCENIFCELMKKLLPDIRIIDTLFLYDTLQ